MKNLNNFINEALKQLITEGFKSSVIKELIKKCKENPYKTFIGVYWDGKMHTFAYATDEGKLFVTIKPFFLGELEDEDVWEKKIFSAEDCKNYLKIKDIDEVPRKLMDLADQKKLMFVSIVEDHYGTLSDDTNWTTSPYFLQKREFLYTVFLEKSAFKKVKNVIDKIKWREFKNNK